MSGIAESKDQKDQQLDEIYEPRPALKDAMISGLQGGAVGFVVSSIQNSLGKHNKGAFGVITRTGGTIGLFATLPAVFTYTENVVANTREKSDFLNGAVGGCAAGFLAGLRRNSFPIAVASCAALGGTIGAIDYLGGFTGDDWKRRRERYLEEELSLQ